MTRKNQSRKEDTKNTKCGYCELCNIDYVNIMVHRRSPQHLAFIRDSNNFRSLDTFIQSGTDVSTFLDKTSVNGERRSLRKLCNGDTEHEVTNGGHSPQANGFHESKSTRSGRCRKISVDTQLNSEDFQYYKVIGVNTKLRSSGAFATPRRDSPPLNCNGGSPGLVVKFRKVRRSELSVLSDEAEQFMFPRRASTSSSEDEEDYDVEEQPATPERRRSLRPPQREELESTISSERRRSARPTALKEESSEDDSLPDERQRRRKRPPPKRSRLAVITPAIKVEIPAPVVSQTEEVIATPQQETKVTCLKWEDGRLKATPAVEELQFAFESQPHNEPWYESFKRQDENEPLVKNVPHIFALYSRSPKLPYELGQLPPLKPNCCPLSDLIKKEDKGAGPSRSYGTRGNKKQKIRKHTVATTLIALEKHPRKSPREHASTLAILGGLLRRKHPDDDEIPTGSEDTCSETNSNVKVEVAPICETQDQSDRLQQFFSEVFKDCADYEIPEETMEGEPTVMTSLKPDIVELVNECENCDIIRNEVKENIANKSPGPVRRGYKFKKKNRTGWPNKKKVCLARVESADTSKSEAGDDTISADSTRDSASELDDTVMEPSVSRRATLQRTTETEGSTEEGGSEISWVAAALQPVVRVAKIDSAVTRRLRSARPGSSRGARARRARSYRFR